jgi:hypothetical protein
MSITLTRVTTLEKQGKHFPTLPSRAIKESTYISEDSRFFIYKIDNTTWGWHSIKDDYVNNINSLNHYDTSKEKVVRALEAYIAEETADLQLWKA